MNAQSSERRLVLLAGVLFTVVLGVTGRMDADDEVMELAYYCRMVEAEAWLDYQEIYEKECENERRRNVVGGR